MKNPLLYKADDFPILRGSGWQNRARYMRLPWRGGEMAGYEDEDTGLRVFRSSEKS